MPNQVVWFDIPAAELDRAIKFYNAVLGLDLKKEAHGDIAMAVFPHSRHGEVSGCIFASKDARPSAFGPLLYLNCQGRLDDAIANVEKNGGKIITPKHPIGPYGSRAIILDSEGNRVALHST
jgi:predicted enzyme related to lactoylglutathione lyase